MSAATWRVLVLYAELGFENTRVIVRTREWAPGELVLEVQAEEGDPVLLAQARGNMVDNALKYAPVRGAPGPSRSW